MVFELQRIQLQTAFIPFLKLSKAKSYFDNDLDFALFLWAFHDVTAGATLWMMDPVKLLIHTK